MILNRLPKSVVKEEGKEVEQGSEGGREKKEPQSLR